MRSAAPNLPAASSEHRVSGVAGAKWKGHTYKVPGQWDNHPNQIASGEREARQGTKTRKWGKSPECSMERSEGRREECGWEVTGEKRRYKSSRSWNHRTESHGCEGKWGSGRTKAAIARTTNGRQTGGRGRAGRWADRKLGGHGHIHVSGSDGIWHTSR